MAVRFLECFPTSGWSAAGARRRRRPVRLLHHLRLQQRVLVARPIDIVDAAHRRGEPGR